MQDKEQQVNECLTAEVPAVVPMNPADFTDRLDHMVPDKG